MRGACSNFPQARLRRATRGSAIRSRLSGAEEPANRVERRWARLESAQDPLGWLFDELEISPLPWGSRPIDANHSRVPGKLLPVPRQVNLHEGALCQRRLVRT